MRYVATEQFLAEHDGIVGLRRRQQLLLLPFGEDRQGRFISWDKDNSFYKWNWSMWHNVELNPLASRAPRGPSDLKGIYLDTMEQAAAAIVVAGAVPPPAGRAADEPVQGWLEREIRRIYAQIHEGAHADSGSW